jgi:hypothetical protein
MIKAAIEKILSLAPASNSLVSLYEYTYSKDSLHRVPFPDQIQPNTIKFHFLSGLCTYIMSGIEKISEKCFIRVIDHNRVQFCSSLQPENDNKRFVYAEAACDNVETFSFGQWFDLEIFIISLQSMFVQTEQISKIISLLGNMASSRVKENKDDGFTQVVQVRVGIQLKDEVPIENPIVLQPYRTFREIEQPESNCILRLKESGDQILCSLHEADGGSWKNKAIENITTFILNYVGDDNIHVIA